MANGVARTARMAIAIPIEAQDSFIAAGPGKGGSVARRESVPPYLPMPSAPRQVIGLAYPMTPRGCSQSTVPTRVSIA